MIRLAITILTVSFCTSCDNTEHKSVKAKERLELIPEPDKDQREKYEAEQKLKKSSCSFSNPDTTVSGIELENYETAISVIGNKDKYYSDEKYHYYSTNGQEVLSLIQHPGNGMYNMSIFNIKLSDKASPDYRKLNIDTFKTEKGIKLGLSKAQIIEKLGNCFQIKDSSIDFIELYYRIESPNDSQTKLLKTHNMPVYYASYKFRKDKLWEFEFGFEYP